MTTKARTQGEKRRAKIGRPPVHGGHYDNGKRRRASRAGEDRQARELRDMPALKRRCAAFGLEPTDANLQRVKASNYGSRLGRLVEHGVITQQMANAGFRFADLRRRFKETQGLPPETAVAASYGEVRGGGGEPREETVEAIRRAHSASEAVFRRLSVMQRRHLVTIAVNDQPIHPSVSAARALQSALRVMMRHFG